MRRTARQVGLAAATVLAVSFPVVSGPPTANAQTYTRAQTAAQTPTNQRAPDVVSQTTFVVPGDTHELSLILDAGPDATMAVTVFERVRSRSAFWDALAGNPRGTQLRLPVDAVADATSSSGITTIAIPTEIDGGLQLDPAGGVHPIHIEITDGELTQELVTFLIALPAETGTSPLKVATVVPFAAPLATTADATTDIDDAQTARLGSLAAGLERSPGPALSVLPRPETVWALSRSTDPEHRAIVEQLRAGVSGREVLATPFVALDPARWVPSGQAALWDTELELGQRTLDALLGVESTTATWLAEDTLDTLALDHLRTVGVENLLADEERLGVIDIDLFRTTLTKPFRVVYGGNRFLPAAQFDHELSEYLADPDDPELAVHRLLADLAVLYLDSPGDPERVAVVRWPDETLPDAVLDTYLDALDGRSDGGPEMLMAITATELFDVEPALADPTDSDSVTLSRQLVSRTSRPAPDMTEPLVTARAIIDSYLNVMDRPAARDDLESLAHLSLSDELDDESRNEYLRAIAESVTAGLEGISGPVDQSFRLRARTTTLELPFTNAQDAAATVVLRFSSDKLDFPTGAERTITLAASGETIVLLEVVGRAAGDATLRIEILSPDGQPLDQSSVIVRSTVLSGVGLGISAVAIAFLLLWWGREIRRSRRANRATAAALVGRDVELTSDDTDDLPDIAVQSPAASQLDPQRPPASDVATDPQLAPQPSEPE